ncbi:hypothetical protein WMY93_029941 [Mugilogobius chulae]|uniref:Ig-like domain-containing protein n=1 Tax=Mugilogobius chulae TaxID=88201 RepID=A0AAW0MWD7_9GOBI
MSLASFNLMFLSALFRWFSGACVFSCSIIKPKERTAVRSAPGSRVKAESKAARYGPSKWGGTAHFVQWKQHRTVPYRLDSNLYTEVSCVLLESCVLPCSFDSGSEDPVINWSKIPGHIPVHSYYHGQNQPEHQHENFTGRTSLFEEELSTGNASLLLSEVKVQDEGTYECRTSSANTTAGELTFT